jgi:hypothetical protein
MRLATASATVHIPPCVTEETPMLSFRSVLVIVCALSASCLVGCDRNKIVDDKNDEIQAHETKVYIVPALDKEHQVRVEISADEEMNVKIGVADGEKLGDILGKDEKKKTVKLEVKIPAGKEARIEITVDKKCMVKTSIRSM